MPSTEELVRFKAISRTFGEHKALDDVTFSIGVGEVHALIGENGAGKSTLGKIVGGSLTPSSGVLHVNGRPVTYRSPADALQDGIATMHQEISLAPHLTVLDNVMLGLESRRFGLASRSGSLRRFEKLREETGFDLNPHVAAGRLSLAAQQEVEIMRALARSAKLIVMDEPTAALPGPAAEKLHAVVRSLRERGTSVVYISHFLDEVVSLSDRISVMRNGRHITTIEADGTTVDDLVQPMLGRTLDANYPPRPVMSAEAPVVLSARGVRPPGSPSTIDVDVKSGEVLGVFGLVGSGRSEFAMTLFGGIRGTAESVTVDGTRFKAASPRAAMEAGLMLLPESRKEQGLYLGLGQRHNASASFLSDVSRIGLVKSRAERGAVRGVLSAMGVDPVDLEGKVGHLSGGNQQKVLFAKSLFREPRVLVLDEPTRGVDVGSRRAIYDRVAGIVDRGAAVILISSELDEVIHLSHRMIVMRAGTVVGEFESASASRDEILNAAFGVLPDS